MNLLHETVQNVGAYVNKYLVDDKKNSSELETVFSQETVAKIKTAIQQGNRPGTGIYPADAGAGLPDCPAARCRQDRHTRFHPQKKGRLTPEEYNQIKEHTTIGANILSAISTISYLEDGARYHHERYDGNGYPLGLSGERIPIIGRIIAVADVYDALVSRRHYKEVMNEASARKELLDGSGTQFDPKIIKIFIGLLDSGVIEEIKTNSTMPEE